MLKYFLLTACPNTLIHHDHNTSVESRKGIPKKHYTALVTYQIDSHEASFQHIFNQLIISAAWREADDNAKMPYSISALTPLDSRWAIEHGLLFPSG